MLSRVGGRCAPIVAADRRVVGPASTPADAAAIRRESRSRAPGRLVHSKRHRGIADPISRRPTAPRRRTDGIPLSAARRRRCPFSNHAPPSSSGESSCSGRCWESITCLVCPGGRPGSHGIASGTGCFSHYLICRTAELCGPSAGNQPHGLAAAAAWDELAEELASAAASFGSLTSELAGGLAGCVVVGDGFGGRGGNRSRSLPVAASLGAPSRREERRCCPRGKTVLGVDRSGPTAFGRPG